MLRNSFWFCNSRVVFNTIIKKPNRNINLEDRVSYTRLCHMPYGLHTKSIKAVRNRFVYGFYVPHELAKYLWAHQILVTSMEQENLASNLVPSKVSERSPDEHAKKRQTWKMKYSEGENPESSFRRNESVWKKENVTGVIPQKCNANAKTLAFVR